MVENDLIFKLRIPESSLRRYELLHEVRNRIAKAVEMPPVSMQTLEHLGKDVLKAANGLDDELAFVMLLCNNELWRPYFEATPYNRRLLLLPKCLKKPDTCEAVFDDIGMICASCSSCQLNTLIDKSEKLGYETLIAEGTTAAISLVEEGAVDAVLGVSCMDVLQKSFKHTVSSAVPAMAIPLLSNGCIDTELDLEWLNNDISAYTENRIMEPLPVSVMHNYVETIFSEKIIFGTNISLFGKTNTEEIALEFMLQGGKRTRPLLAYLAYKAYSTDFDQSIADQLMLVVECFHKASLIHDDIEDQDNYRYNKKTVHFQHGIPIAVNAGDYLIGIGYKCLATLPVPENHRTELFKLFSSLHVASTIGQGEELIAMKDEIIYRVDKMLHIFRHKTGSAIRVSLLSGAISGNAPDHDLEVLKKISDLFGIAYQIRDDLQEFRGLADDQQTASFPILKSILVENHSIQPEDEDQWKKTIAEYEVDQEAQEMLNQMVEALRSSVFELSSHKLRLALLYIVNRMFDAS